MIFDARQLPTGTTIECEVCIVGAGAAGIALALELRNAGFRTVLLESGGLEFDGPTQNLYVGENRGVPNYDLNASRLRYFGGSTNCWAGWCRPLETWDFEPVPGSQLRRWPIRRTDLDPYYAKAQVVCQLGPFDYDNLTPWLDASHLPVLPLAPNRLQTGIFQVSPPSRFGSLYRRTLEQSDAVSVYLHANAVELVTDEAGSQLTVIRAACLGGVRFEVKPRFAILATGGLENARILLLSNRTQHNGLGNGNDVVGRYFMDHLLLTTAGYAVFSAALPDMDLYFRETKALGTSIFGTLVPPGPDPDLGGFRVWIRPSYRLVQGIDSLKTIGSAVGSATLPTDGLWHHVRQVLSDYDAIADAAYKTLFHTKKGLFASYGGRGDVSVVGAQLDLNWEQLPNADSRVTLSDERDALGQNRLVLDWQPQNVDRLTYAKAMRLVGEEFGRLGLGRVKSADIGEGSHWPWDLQGSRHHMGTTRMAEDPRLGVVDANCRVHGVANLYIAGSSVFATGGYANPTLTIVALALRLADEIKRQLA